LRKEGQGNHTVTSFLPPATRGAAHNAPRVGGSRDGCCGLAQAPPVPGCHMSVRASDSRAARPAARA